MRACVDGRQANVDGAKGDVVPKPDVTGSVNVTTVKSERLPGALD